MVENHTSAKSDINLREGPMNMYELKQIGQREHINIPVTGVSNFPGWLE